MSDDRKSPEDLSEIVDNLLKEMNSPSPEFQAMLKEFDEEMDEIFKCFNCKRKRSEQSKDNCCEYCKPRPKYPDHAPEGTIFVCGACGKTSNSIYGDDQNGIGSWDESCMLNAVLCEADSFEQDGQWKAVKWDD